MNLVEQVDLMQEWLTKLSEIKKRRASKEIDDIQTYNMIDDILKNNKNELELIELYDVYEYAKEYFLLRIQ